MARFCKISFFFFFSFYKFAKTLLNSWAMKRKENTLLPDQFYSLTHQAAQEGSLGRHQEQHGQVSTSLRPSKTHGCAARCSAERLKAGWKLPLSSPQPRFSSSLWLPRQQGTRTLIKALSERLPSALRDALTHALGKGCSRERQKTAALNKTWNMRFKFTGSQAELILIFRDQ